MLVRQNKWAFCKEKCLIVSGVVATEAVNTKADLVTKNHSCHGPFSLDAYFLNEFSWTGTIQTVW